MDNKTVFLKGKRVILRPLRKETDLEAVLRWINDPKVRCYRVRGVFPQTAMAEAEWFDAFYKKPDEVVLGIETDEGIFIGIMGVHNINWVSRTATTGAIIGEKRYWNKGYGTDAKMALLKYAFETLGLRKINSAVYGFNGRSVAYSQRCGYRIEGRRRKQLFRNGRFHDEIFLGVFYEEWKRAYKKWLRAR